NDSEQEQEGIGQGKLYAPPNKVLAAAGMTKIDTQLEKGTGKGKLYPAQGTAIQNKNDVLPSKEHSVDTQIKGKREEEEDDEEEGSAQGKLYSPGTALNNRIDHSQLWNKGKGVLEASKGVAGDIRRSLSQMKDRIVDKLAAVPVPADALDNARQSLESIIKDVTHAAQGLTKDAVHKIKVRLAEILPFVSPIQTGK
ncbi:hypothetical protein KI387_035597, partial [Taxus chinensis]